MTTCPNCKRNYKPVLPGRDPFAFLDYQRGKHLHQAFPHALPFECEQLISGLCSDECWDDFLGKHQTDQPDEPGAVDRFGDPIPERRARFPASKP